MATPRIGTARGWLTATHAPAVTTPEDGAIMPGFGWQVEHFSQSNPDGPDQGDVAALLRRVADTIETLGDITVQDLVFHQEFTADDADLLVTVYYHLNNGSER
jgi:hypothetical protein